MINNIKKNIDLNEIAKFNSIANHWWNINGKFRILHQMNPVRLDYIINRVNVLFGKKILDIGCGGGILSESMAYEGAEVTGIDMSLKSIKVAKQHAIENNLIIKYIQQTVEEHAKIYPNNYEIITCMELLEHVLNPSSIVNSCAQLIKPNGSVFFSTLNRNIKSWIVAIFGAEYVLRAVPHGTHQFSKFIKPAELLTWLDKTSLNECDIIGLYYNIFHSCFYLSNNININYILHAIRQD